MSKCVYNVIYHLKIIGIMYASPVYVNSKSSPESEIYQH